MSTRGSKVYRVGVASWMLAAIFFFYAWILRVSPSVMVEQLMRDFAIGGAIIGNLSAFYFYAYAVLQVPVGMALDRWGARRVLSIALLLAAAGSALSAVAPTIEIAYAGRLLIGAGSAFAFVGSLVLAAAWFEPRRFAFLSGTGMAIGLVGGIVGQGPFAVLVDQEGWRSSLLLVAAGGGALALLSWAVIRDRPPGGPVTPLAHDANSGGTMRALWAVAKRRQTIIIACFAGCMSSPMLAFGTLWGVPYARVRFDLDQPTAAFYMASALFGFVFGGPFWGWISDRVGRRKPIMILGAVICCATMTALLYLPGVSAGVFRLLVVINGFGIAAMGVSYAVAREHNAGGGTGAALGLVNMAAVAGGALFQPIVGILLDNAWDGKMVAGARVYSIPAYDSAFLLLPALYVAAILLALMVRETYCRPVESSK